MDDLPALDRRLDPTSTAPLVVAFSGGGDSLALLIAVRHWTERAGRPVLAVTVDHQLQAAGAAWAEACARTARRLGVEHRTLVWEGEKPATGVAGAARHARHTLIAEAARQAGACVILMGHTADDCLEARLMRADGVSASEPREWSPSPVWPAGRGLFILRPMLHLRRAAIREHLAAAGETWIDDPANADPRHPRVRARQALERGADPGPPPDIPDLAPLLAHTAFTPQGSISLEREAFPLLGQALLCAAGTTRPPRRDRVAGIVSGKRVISTLAGARIIVNGSRLFVSREPGELVRTNLKPLPLVPGEPFIWDGRFEITAHIPDLIISPPPPSDRSIHPTIWPVRPFPVSGEGAPDHRPYFTLRCLVRSRFVAACGGFPNEAALPSLRR